MPAARNRQPTIVVALLAALAMTVVAIDGDPMLFRLGLVVFMVAASIHAHGRTGINVEILEKMRLDGYDEGFVAGCRAARRSDGLPRLALVSPPDELCQQERVWRGTDRVS